jgi:hypothetical protein
MPFFRSTYNIVHTPWEDEVFNPNWMDSNKLILPPGGPDDPRAKWDYNRDMKISDVDLWEQIYYGSGNWALYAAWLPYAEFYMITTPYWYISDKTEEKHQLLNIETFYGKNAGVKAYQRARELDMFVPVNEIWIDDEELWLHENEKITWK